MFTVCNVGKIAIYDFAANSYAELLSKGENSWFPMVVGESVYYASDRDQGTVNLYPHDLATKQDTQLTKYSDADVRWPSTDGMTLVYEHDGYLHAYDVASGRDATLTFDVKGDELSARPYVLKVGRNITSLSPSPKGNRIAVEAWVDPAAEWRQMFWEAWRVERDGFIREDLWGLDWHSLGRHYEQYLPHVRHR